MQQSSNYQACYNVIMNDSVQNKVHYVIIWATFEAVNIVCLHNFCFIVKIIVFQFRTETT